MGSNPLCYFLCAPADGNIQSHALHAGSSAEAIAGVGGDELEPLHIPLL